MRARPGSYRRLIQSYRNHLKAARPANPDRLVVMADARLATDNWAAKRIAEAAALPGATRDGGVVSVPFTAEHAYLLCHLPREATRWLVLDEDRLPTAAKAKQTHETQECNKACSENGLPHRVPRRKGRGARSAPRPGFAG